MGESTIYKDVTIVNRRGLHARAAAKFVKAADRFTSSIAVQVTDDIRASGTSILGLMMLAASTGTVIKISATGADAEQAVDTLAGLVERGFDEE
ncbi:phosphocarrier protein [Arboricoccus pini]|uniref:Phosphocarrier protein n=1 Tax=Arboricoccus pini TaxID=1963835 RepID=A0A212QZV7_9PROT|nr:HPr family phosphocarrier protein [Arboricoccus pini]SNB65226.1 phosphocarrier protein [Arboricoccus pini]